MSEIAKAAAILREARRCAVFTGAGVSADSGVPTFRGASADAQWARLDPMRLATPEGFRADPELVYDWYTQRRRQLAGVHPNAAHAAIAQLQQQGAVLITQNVDDLHERIAPARAKILKVHGTLMEDKCSRCTWRERLEHGHLPHLRPCPECGAWMRPAVVWFGETLDPETWEQAEEAVMRCDVLLVVGTSGQVYPAAGLVDTAHDRRAKVIVVNLEPGPLDIAAQAVVHGRASEMVPRIVPVPPN